MCVEVSCKKKNSRKCGKKNAEWKLKTAEVLLGFQNSSTRACIKLCFIKQLTEVCQIMKHVKFAVHSYVSVRALMYCCLAASIYYH